MRRAAKRERAATGQQASSSQHYASDGEKLHLRAAPVYHPSEAEFANPLAYVAAIREEASKYGVATIVPPRSWHPRFNLRKDTLKFRVQIQHLAELQRRLHAEEGLKAFRDDYAEFLERQQDGTAGRGRADKAPPQKPPTLGGAVVDLGRLFRIVTELGGAQKVSETKKWKDVARLLKVGQSMNNAAYALRLLYGKYLGRYELYRRELCRSPAPAVSAASCPPGASAAAAACSPPPGGAGAWRPGGGAGPPAGGPGPGWAGAPALTAAAPASPRKPAAPAARPSARDGFAAVVPLGVFPAFGEGDAACAEGAGGLLALKRRPVQPEDEGGAGAGGAGAVERRIKRQKAGDDAAASAAPPLAGAATVSGTALASAAAAAAAGTAPSSIHEASNATMATPLDPEQGAITYLAESARERYAMDSDDGHDDEATPPESPSSGVSFDVDDMVMDGAGESVRLDQMCGLCNGGHHEEQMVLCDVCDDGYHIFCLSPPLTAIPEGDWICPRCQAASDAAAHPPSVEDGGEIDFPTFCRIADGFMSEYVGGESRAVTASWQELEAEFWRVVEGAIEPVEVMAGVDLDVMSHGSGFPRRRELRPLEAPNDPGSSQGANHGADANERRRRGSGLGDEVPMCSDGIDVAESAWNLNNVAHVGGRCPNLLRCLEGHAPGKVTPRLSFGMLFSSTPWRTEDHNLYSLTYHHFGGEKLWYSVPNGSLDAFVNAARRADPLAATTSGDVDMVHPHSLLAHGVPVYRAVQRARQFVVVFPGAITAQVDAGLNATESVATAPLDWLPLSRAVSVRCRDNRHLQSICHTELVLEEAVGIDIGDVALKGAPDELSGAGSEWEREEHEELGACGGADAPAEALRRLQGLAPEVACWLAPEVSKIAKDERELREAVRESGTVRSAPLGRCGGRGSDAKCAICHEHLHLSALECTCTSGRLVCLRHAHLLCECQPVKRTLLWRYSLEALDVVAAEATQRASTGTDLALVAKSKEPEKPLRRKEAAEWETKARAALRGQWAVLNVAGADRVSPLAAAPAEASLESDADGTAARQRLGGGRVRKEKRRYDPTADEEAVLVAVPKNVVVEDEAEPAHVSTKEALEALMEERQQLSWGGADTRASRVLASALRALCNHADEVANALEGRSTVSIAERLVAAEQRPVSPAFLAGRGPDPALLPCIPETVELVAALPSCKAVARRLEKVIERGRHPDLLARPDPSEYEELARECANLLLRPDGADAVSSRGAECSAWRKSVARLFPSTASQAPPDELPSIEDGRRLLRTGLDLGAALPELPRLQAAVEACDAFLSKAGAVADMGSNASPVAFENLAAEADGLELSTRESATAMIAIDALVRWKASFRSTVWDFASAGRGTRGRGGGGGGTANAAAVCAAKADSLVESARALPVRLAPECALLGVLHDLAEWAREGEGVLMHKPLQIMEDIAAVGKAGEELLARFEEALASSAQTWHAPRMAGSHTAEPPEGTPPAMAELFAAVVARSEFAQQWEARAVEVLSGATRGEQFPLDELASLFREGQTSGVALPSMKALTAIVDKSKRWLEGAQSCLVERISRRNAERGQALPAFTTVERLLAEIPSLVGVAHREVELLRDKHAQAVSWRSETAALLATPPPIPLEEFDRLLEDSHRLGLDMAEAGQLQARREGVVWMAEADVLLAKAHPCARADANGDAEMVPSQTETDADGDQVSQPVDSRPSLEDVQRLGTRRPRGDWTAHAAERHDAEERGTRLCVVTEAGEAWLQLAVAALEEAASVSDCCALLASERSLSCAVPASAAALQDAVEAAEAWLKAVTDSIGPWIASLEPAVERAEAPVWPKLSLVERHLRAAATLRCSIPVLDRVRSAASAVEAWRERTAMRIAHAPDVGKLAKVLELARGSSAAALLNTDPASASAHGGGEGNGVCSQDEHAGVFCLCRRLYDGGSTMMGCDRCGDWYHVSCLGLTAKSVRTLEAEDVYLCPLCIAGSIDPTAGEVCAQLKRRQFPAYHEDDNMLASASAKDKAAQKKASRKTVGDAGDSAVGGTRATSAVPPRLSGLDSWYPAVSDLEVALEECASLPCEPDEMAVIAEVLANVATFDARVCAVLDGKLDACAPATAGEGGSPSQVMLKEALALKVSALPCIPRLIDHLNASAFERYLAEVGVDNVVAQKAGGLAIEWGATRRRS